MACQSTKRRVLILANPDKPGAPDALASLCSFVRDRAELTDASCSLDVSRAVSERPDRIIVLGGDGTLIGVARAMGEAQSPLIGVNMGKLGFLAEFSLESLCHELDAALGDDRLISRRMMLDVTLELRGGRDVKSTAVNDCVIQMGPPFRMITLSITIDGEHLTRIRGDGLAVCTPTGSTAHSLSAGGPVMSPELRAIGLTPFNPHSLTHRPVVFGPDVVLEIRPEAVNSGSSVIIDGQVTHPLTNGDIIRVRRAKPEFHLVRHPRSSPWHNLVNKLHWGQTPAE